MSFNLEDTLQVWPHATGQVHANQNNRLHALAYTSRATNHCTTCGAEKNLLLRSCCRFNGLFGLSAPSSRFPYLSPRQVRSAIHLHHSSWTRSQSPRNAASPFQFPMESSSGVGPITAAPLPENLYTEYPSSGMTAIGSLRFEGPGMDYGAADGLGLFDTMGSLSNVDIVGVSGVGQDVNGGSSNGADGEAARTLNSLATWPANLVNGDLTQSLNQASLPDPFNGSHDPAGIVDLPGHEVQSQPHHGGGKSLAQFDSIEVDPQNAKAYAKLVFADGDLFITTHDVMLGRNMERFEQMRRRKKQERRAREELDTYRKEPSQPSQPGDEDHQAAPSHSSQSLEGRPAPPSNFSEHGGSVWYPPEAGEEGHVPRLKPKRRISHFSKSSSTTSVAPANLHTGSMSDLSNPYNEPDVRTFAFIPIHTPAAEDITKISKEHLMFSFNFQEEQWELKVIGNRAFVNEELFEKGTVVPLQHGDEVIIATVHMVFKLPDNFRQSPGLSRGTFSKNSDEDIESEDDSAASTSPARRLSNAMEAETSDSEQEEGTAEPTAAQKRPKLKIKTGKLKRPDAKDGKGKGKSLPRKSESKKPVSDEVPEAESPKAMKKPEKVKKSKEAEDEADEAVKTEQSPPPTTPFIKPGSALEGIPLEDLPEKRKGPGRPPKEGNVSKRDTALASKKRKEYEKRGEEPPLFKDLVAMVRRENKAKEMQAKLVANGQLEADMDIMPSIEADGSGGVPVDGQVQGDGTNATPSEAVRRSPPRPKRTVRAMSPVKPLEECTEDDLKKPDRTYVHILDEVLQHHSGPADLPEIYERMQKRHPYFKYRCKTLGWQSSVRHNLQQSLRFKDVGKAGKGKLWAVDLEVPLEKEKKRKATPPKPPMHNGQFMPGQMPHPQYGGVPYGNPYAQPMPNGQQGLGPPHGQGIYYNPYAPPGTIPHQGPNGTPQGQGPPYRMHPPPPQHHHHSGPAPHPPPPSQPLPSHMQSLVEELVQFHSRHIQQYAPETPECARQKLLLHNVTEYLSAYFHGSQPSEAICAEVRGEEYRGLYESLMQVFRRHKIGFVAPDPFAEEGGSKNGEGEGGSGDGAAAAATMDAGAEVPNGQQQISEERTAVVSPLVANPAAPVAEGSVAADPKPGVPANPLKRSAEEAADEIEPKRQKEDGV